MSAVSICRIMDWTDEMLQQEPAMQFSSTYKKRSQTNNANNSAVSWLGWLG